MSPNPPTYLSSHSADVILSDIRPIKLKIDALLGINALLDEFLHRILQAANSFSTDRLRDGLLIVLPTSIGKELLLEAEVELRAYWHRTSPTPAAAKGSDDFRLPVAFELLRAKCGAYSTLNDAVQDPETEVRMSERLAQGAEKLPPAAVIAPAALYLTAILEAMCEHILSNVGRVASRDSSRMHATGQDLFTALCEDGAVYGLFKHMQVYEQIEAMSKGPKHRRSKSLSRNDRQISSQSDLHDPASSPRTRLSSDSGSANMTGGAARSSSRASSEKSRAKKFFSSSRASQDGSISQHQRADSQLGGETRDDSMDSDYYKFEDPSALQEFDNLMRSESTMKVSLTPDRLRSMEALKQEKSRGKNQGPPVSPLRLNKPEQKSPPSSSHPRHTPQRSLRHVDSIIEDEEEPVAQNPALRKQSSSSSVPINPPTASSNSRSRSASSSAQMSNFAPPRAQGNGSQRINGRSPSSNPLEINSGFPAKTRTIQKNRESLDLDDVMGGSDDEVEVVPSPKTPRSTSKRGGGHANVTSSTRELLDFLNEGPPDAGAPTQAPTVSKNNRDLIDFLASGPPDLPDPQPILSPDSKKGSGRLQRMMSKLSLSASDRARSQDDANRALAAKSVASSPMPIAPKPIPPRPRIATPPVSPPPSPPQSPEVLPSVVPAVQPMGSSNNSRPRMHSVSRKAVPIEDKPESPLPVPVKKRPVPITTQGHNGDVSLPNSKEHIERKSEQAETVGRRASSSPSVRRSSKSAQAAVEGNVPTVGPQPTVNQPSISIAAAQDIRHLLSRATNADECRVIFDMFMARSGMSFSSTDDGPVLQDTKDPYPSPVSEQGFSDQAIEGSLVEMLLSVDRSPLPSAKPALTPTPQPDSAAKQPEHVPGQDSNNPAQLVVTTATQGSSEQPRTPLPQPSPSTDVMAAMIPSRPIRRKQSRVDPRVDSAQHYAQPNNSPELAA